jgi:predicted PurR-regulated permease PerM
MTNPSRGVVIPLIVVGLIAFGMALIAMKSILMPLAVAFFLANLAGPVIALMKKIRIPTGLAIIIIIFITAVVFFLLGEIFYKQVLIFKDEIGGGKTSEIQVKESGDGRETVQAEPAGTEQPGGSGDDDSKLGGYDRRFKKLWNGFLDAMPEPVREQLEVINWNELLPGKTMARYAATTVGSIFGLLGMLILIILYMVFILTEKEQAPYRLRKAFSEEESNRISTIIGGIQKQTEAYISGKTVISLATGSLVTLLLWIFGVKFFFIWGLLTFLLNFIPNIGSFIATLLPLAMATIQPDPEFSFGKIVFLVVCLIVIQFTVGSVLEPRLLGQRLQLSPFVVFLSFILWGWLWGVPGMILSTPIMATLKIVMENVEPLKPYAVLISTGKPETAK